jgi:hypothetical protein
VGAPVRFSFTVTVLFFTSFSMPPNWSNMVFNLAVTSSSYDAAFAMATGAAGAELAFASDWGAAFTNGVAATMASHSLRVMVFPSWVLLSAGLRPQTAAPFLFDMLPLTRLSSGGLGGMQEKRWRKWQEMITDPEQKIARPRQVYTGQVSRDVMPIEKRVIPTTAPTA